VKLQEKKKDKKKEKKHKKKEKKSGKRKRSSGEDTDSDDDDDAEGGHMGQLSNFFAAEDGGGEALRSAITGKKFKRKDASHLDAKEKAKREKLLEGLNAEELEFVQERQQSKYEKTKADKWKECQQDPAKMRELLAPKSEAQKAMWAADVQWIQQCKTEEAVWATMRRCPNCIPPTVSQSGNVKDEGFKCIKHR
jgi:hypothetical protein